MNPSHNPTAPISPQAPVAHYENFPVASWLCPPALRPAVTAIYHFARTADDLADEGEHSPEARLQALAAYRAALERCVQMPAAPVANGATLPTAWPGLFGHLATVVQRHALPVQPLHDLITAFEQDVRHTASAHRYADTQELMAYCQLSANPIGRLLLHLYGVTDATSLRQSDHICSALQLINFWQDITVDLPRQRVYLPRATLAAHGLELDSTVRALSSPTGLTGQPAQQLASAVAELCSQARALMQTGAPLALRLPGRAGWELRLVVQGGLRILDKIAQADHRSWLVRPSVTPLDAPRVLWRAARMRPAPPA